MRENGLDALQSYEHNELVLQYIMYSTSRVCIHTVLYMYSIYIIIQCTGYKQTRLRILELCTKREVLHDGNEYGTSDQ